MRTRILQVHRISLSSSTVIVIQSPHKLSRLFLYPPFMNFHHLLSKRSFHIARGCRQQENGPLNEVDHELSRTQTTRMIPPMFRPTQANDSIEENEIGRRNCDRISGEKLKRSLKLLGSLLLKMP